MYGIGRSMEHRPDATALNNAKITRESRLRTSAKWWQGAAFRRWGHVRRMEFGVAAAEIQTVETWRQFPIGDGAELHQFGAGLAQQV